MSHSNDYSVLALPAIKRLQDISKLKLTQVPSEVFSRLNEEIKFHEETLEFAFKYRTTHGPRLGQADSEVYFREKLSSLITFTEMAVDPLAHGGNYSKEKVIDNVNHYSHLVSKLVAVSWSSLSSKPASDKAIKDSAFENYDALKRLVDR